MKAVKYTDPDGRDHTAIHQTEGSGDIDEVKPVGSMTYEEWSRSTRTGGNGLANRDDEWGVYAIYGGTVIKVNWDESASVYGRYVIIEDPNGNFARYAHLDSIDYELGDTVNMGYQIGVMGSTGKGLPGPNKHLHVSVYPAGTPDTFQSAYATINPETYISGGAYPCNTSVSTYYKDRIGNPEYRHEGTDFSGQAANLLGAWQNGIWGKVIQ